MKNWKCTFVCTVVLSLVAIWNSPRVYAETIQPIETLVDAPSKQVRKVDKIDFAYRASQWYLRGATGLDLTTTVIGMEASHGVEGGWAKCFGRRNTAAVVLANGVVDYGVDYLSHRLYQRGGRGWRIAATIMNGVRATTITFDGLHNVNYIRRH